MAPAVEKNGTYINWEGRLRPFGQARSATSLTDRDVLVRLTEEFDLDLGITALADLYEEVNPLMEWDGDPQDFTPASGIAPGADATLETERGSVTLPAAIADLPDSVAWVPECSTGSVIHENLGGAGTVATLRATQEVAR